MVSRAGTGRADPAAKVSYDHHQHHTTFHRDGYRLLRGVLPVPLCQFIASYFALLVSNDYMVLNDGQVEQGYGAYGLPMSETLLASLTPVVAKVAGEPLFPTYSYARVYLNGAVLERHTDRNACEVNCSVTGLAGPGPASGAMSA